MRKSILLLMSAVVLLTSCKGQEFGLVYNVEAAGDADGIVMVTFPDGELTASGNASLNFAWGNDTVQSEPQCLMTLMDAYTSNEPEIRNAAFKIDDLVSEFSATALEGTYCIHFVGYVTETLTGVTVSIDKTLTNRE